MRAADRFPGAVTAAVLLLAAGVAAQRVRELRLADCFTLERALLPEHPEPCGWIDAERYLAFVDARDGGDPFKTFVAVDARSGERSPWLGGGHLTALAALPGLRLDLVRAALGERRAFHWSADHETFVASIGGDLFAYRRGGPARRLTRSAAVETAIELAPDGSMVAFVRDGDLHVATLDGEACWALTEGGGDDVLHGLLDHLHHEELFARQRWQGYWWSPDSTRIALLKIDQSQVQELTIPSDVPGTALHESIRYPTAGEANPIVALGVVDVGGGAPRWLDLGQWLHDEPLVVRVTWHPSGDELWFQIQDREQRWLEMVAADSATGELRSVFREDSPCWVEAGPEPIWIAGGAEFLWRSERDGFAHLYRYRRDGELLGRLTAGEFDVEEVLGVDPAAGLVWFLSDRGDVKQRQLFKVALAGGEPLPITELPGWHEVDPAPDFSKFVDACSRATQPATCSIRDATGEELRRIATPRLDLLDAQLVRAPEFVTIPARDGFPLEAMLLRPADFDAAKRYPVVQLTYAGPGGQRVLDRWAGRDALWQQRLAQLGYVVFSVDNRAASGRGRASACTAFRRFGPGAMADLEDGADWLVEQGIADPERIAIHGWSFGGYQVLFNLTHSRKWAAGIAVNPVTDWRFYDTVYAERYMGLPQTNIAGYREASVLEAAAELHGELLLAHATMDDNVHLRNSTALVHALQLAGKRFRFMPYPRARHGIDDLRQQYHLFGEIEAFLAATIGGGR